MIRIKEFTGCSVYKGLCENDTCPSQWEESFNQEFLNMNVWNHLSRTNFHRAGSSNLLQINMKGAGNATFDYADFRVKPFVFIWVPHLHLCHLCLETQR